MAANIVWGSMSVVGAEHRVGRPRHRRVDGDNIVWGTLATATTSSGARSTATTSSGAPATATTSSGAPRTATTSCGARRRRQHRLGHRRERGDNIVWGTTESATTSCGGRSVLEGRDLLMEKMPYQPRPTRAGRLDDSAGRRVDGRPQRLAHGLPTLTRFAGHAARAARERRAVAVRGADDRGSVALHFAAADDRRRVRAVHRLDAPPARGRPVCLLRRRAARLGHGRSACFRSARSSPTSDSASGASRSPRSSGAPACSRTARGWRSTSRSTRSGTHRLEARAALQNGRGNGALRKVGAVQEGVLRRSFLRNGEYLDQALWTILAGGVARGQSRWRHDESSTRRS